MQAEWASACYYAGHDAGRDDMAAELQPQIEQLQIALLQLDDRYQKQVVDVITAQHAPDPPTTH